MKNQEYTVDDIKVLDDREHVRLRTPIYLGSVEPTEFNIPKFIGEKFKVETVEFIPAVYKAINEIVDNSLDEFAQLIKLNKTLKIEGNALLGEYSISDNGRGIPIDLHETGKHGPEIVFGSLRSGRNFSDDKNAGVIGQNGVGSSCTNFCSAYFHVDIHRNGKRYQQEFHDGGLKVTKPSIRNVKSEDTGTSVSFQLDGEVFKSTSLPDDLMHNRAMEIALTNPGVIVHYNKHRYRYNHGFDDLIKKFSGEFYKFHSDGMEWYVIFDVYEGIDEQMFTYVNSSLLFDGGVCNTQFQNAFYDAAIDHVKKEAKKRKCEVTKNDVRANLLIIGNLRLSDPVYDSQSKTRMIAPGIRRELDEMIAKHWKQFVKKHGHWFETVLERAARRHHSSADDKAAKDLEKKAKKKVPGLVDATGDDRSKCVCFVTEGDCLEANTRVVTVENGEITRKSLSDIEVGDLVLTHQNRFKAVTCKTSKVVKHVEIKTPIGSLKMSSKHKMLAYDRISDEFIFILANSLDKSRHQLVRSKLDKFEYVAQITKIEPHDHERFSIKIEYGGEEIFSSPKHTFMVYEYETSSILEIEARLLSLDKHGMAMFRK